jgi:tetratricopeptide (TPR) repeat protein
MEKQTQLEAWKFFLKGRLAQEKGNNDEALKAFEDALKHDPSNHSFLNAKAIALNALNRPMEALATGIQNSYEELAKKYVGVNDKPELWIEGLQKLISDVDKGIAGKVGISAVCW